MLESQHNGQAFIFPMKVPFRCFKMKPQEDIHACSFFPGPPPLAKKRKRRTPPLTLTSARAQARVRACSVAGRAIVLVLVFGRR